MTDPDRSAPPDPQAPLIPASRRGVRVKAVVAVVIAVLALVIVFQNTATGEVRFLFWKASMPVWVWLFVMLVAGVVIGSLIPLLWRRRRSGK